MASFSGVEDGLQMLLLCNGLNADDLLAVIEKLKNDSKSAGTHKRRELYWEGYTAMASSCSSSTEGTLYCMIKYTTFEGEGTAEFVELTRRQRGLVSGGCDIVGCKKHKPDVDGEKAAGGGGSSGWVAAWSEEEAMAAFDDITAAESCIYLTGDGLYVGTRFKRVQCKAYGSSPLKSLKDIELAVADVTPKLRSISWTDSSPPNILPYNIILCGVTAALAESLPASLGACSSSGSFDVYDTFLTRRSDYEIGEAHKMLAQMHTDMAKGLQPLIYSSSMKDASIARKNALLKKCYVHESKKKFIDACRADDIECKVIHGAVDNTKEFHQYGGIVFELFYRCDLSVFS